MSTSASVAGNGGRRARLAAARLYLVCPPSSNRPSAPDGELDELLRSAIAGGVDLLQLRDKHASDAELIAIARVAKDECEQAGALLIVNDRPLVAREAGADGVHVGQQDMPVAQVRELVGPEMLIGLSTHTRAEIDALGDSSAGLRSVDYIGVGPVYETPTKPGRPAVGLELVRYASANSPVPFFAIGGIDADNLPEVIGAGARRAVVLRAIADARSPERAARELRDLLDAHPLKAPSRDRA